MLGFFRDNIRKFAIFLWIAVIAFVVGGAYLFVRGPFTMGGNTAIKVGNVKITTQEYQKTYNNIYKFYVQLLTKIKGGNITDSDIKKLNIKQKTIDTLVDRTLLLQEAQKEGIKVSDADVEKAVEANSAFYSGGRFSKQKYLAILKANNINPKDYEGSIHTSLFVDKLKNRLFKNDNVTAKDIRKYFEENYSKVNLDYIYLPFKKMEKYVKVDDKQLKAYYDKHKEEFRIPTMLRFKYALIGLNYAKSQIDVSDNESKQFYDNHISSFNVPKRIKVAHILIENKDNKTNAEFKRAAYAVYNQIKNKKITFKKAVKKYSSDTYTKKVGGDIGYVTKNMVVPGFWKGIKNLKAGELSKPFRSKFGYHIAKIENIKKPYIRKYKDVKSEIINYIKTKKAEGRLFIDAKKIFVKVRDSKKDLKDVVKSLGFNVKISNYMSLKNPQKPFTANIVRSALMGEKGHLLGPDAAVGGYVIYEISGKKPSYIPPFSKVKDEVSKAYIVYTAQKIAEDKAQSMYKKLKKGEKFSKAARETGLTVKKSNDVSKLSPDEKMKCTLKDSVMKNIFAHKTGFFDKCSVKDGIYVYLIGKKTANEKDFTKYRKSIKEQLSKQKEFKIMNDFINKLKKRVKIKINPKL